MADINVLIDSFLTEAELANGKPAAWLEIQGAHVRGIIDRPATVVRMPAWTEEEEKFVRQNRGILSLTEIAARLGRSPNAIKVRGYRIQAASPRYADGFISGNQIAGILGMDSHTPPAWIDRGILEGELYPYEGRINRRVKWPVFLRWLIRPTSWVYFDVKKIKNVHLRRLVELAQEKWGDQWMTTREAADLRGCTVDDIDRGIKYGRLYGYHAGSLERLRTWMWAHWFVLRSEVERVEIPKGKGISHEINWSPRADAFIVRAWLEGVSVFGMSRMMKWSEKRITYRIHLLKKKGILPNQPKKIRTGIEAPRRKGEPIKHCDICGKRISLRAKVCSEECKTERSRRNGRASYKRKHPNMGKPRETGARTPRAIKAKVKRMCEICQARPCLPKANICNSPECRAERIRRYGKAAYQRRKEKLAIKQNG
jgi:hypothetical protein